jgi:hypothetical protein
MTDTSSASPAAEPDDNADRRQAAMQLRRQRPRWVVIWAPAGHFCARPLFRAPRGTCLTAQTPEEMITQMDQVEQAASKPRDSAGGPTRQPGTSQVPEPHERRDERAGPARRRVMRRACRRSSGLRRWRARRPGAAHPDPRCPAHGQAGSAASRPRDPTQSPRRLNRL